VTGIGPNEPATKPLLASVVADAISSTPRDLRRHDVHLVHERAQLCVFRDPLEKLRILASACRFALKQEIVQPERRGAEGVRLNDVGAGFEIMPVDFLDHLRPAEEERLVVALQVLAGPTAETLPAELLFA
jgi:hypothetical protein